MVTAPATPAMKNPATRAALRKNFVIRWPLLLVSLACGPLAVMLLDRFDQPAVHGAAKKFGVLGAELAGLVFVIGTVFGGVFVWIQHRRRKALRRNPWAVWPIRYIATGRAEWVELIGPNGDPVSALLLSTWPKDVGKLVNHSTSEIWFAGYPAKYGVISAPGGGDLRYAYRSRSRPVPRFTFRTDDSSGSRRDRAAPSRPEYELTREGSHPAMKLVGEAPEAAKPFGRKGDSRYPSPRMLRRTLAFLLDWVIHVGCGVGAAVAVSPEFSMDAAARHDWSQLGVNPVVAIGFFLAASAFDRIVIQSIFHTTIGKALFGLVVVRPQDGKYPSFGRLLAVWLFHVYLPLGIWGGAGPEQVDDYFLPAVRRRDVVCGSST
ncbi:RDD family protein [Nocardia sp. NPDC006044]|uniref:RDD family protein n=1 Tax=Nocardia sp. NPDC006044 TaxID=3364306 RepID=UPI0036BC9801